ncbi:hypothetical protein [Anaerosinus sp.]
MDLDSKQKVLLAIYTEYQKDIPKMELITNVNLDMDSQVFRIAVDKLQSEGFIIGAKIHFPAGNPYPDKLIPHFIKMTREGIEFVEEKMEIQRSWTSKEKVEDLKIKFGKLGWDALSDFAAKTLVEILKQTI